MLHFSPRLIILYVRGFVGVFRASSYGSVSISLLLCVKDVLWFLCFNSQMSIIRTTLLLFYELSQLLGGKILGTIVGL